MGAQELAAIEIVLGNREVMIESGGSQARDSFELRLLPLFTALAI
jgi:hypothetical protein